MHLSRALLLLSTAALASAATPDGQDLYTKNCAACHEALTVLQNHIAMKSMSADYIVRVMDHGAMRDYAAKLNKDERAAIATFLADKAPSASTTVASTTGRCSGEAPKGLSGPQWNGWGVDLENTRFQPAEAAGITAAQVPKLKLKWAFGFPGDFSAYAQPSIAGGRVFVGSPAGVVYSLDAKSGCTYWSFQAASGVRTGITIGPGDIAYFGDAHASVYALDAITGKQIWKTTIDDYPTARVTSTLKLYEGRLYMGVASRDEWHAANPTFPCCKFRGSVVALDAKTGKQAWKTYTIAEPARVVGKTKANTEIWGPSGVGVWTSPSIDTKRKVLYVGTGDNYSVPATPLSDAILAIDLATGKVVWSKQITEGDVFNGNCLQTNLTTCPKEVGPDSDFGSSPILRTLPSGRSVIIAGQKSGVVYALDPDKKGAIVWETRVGKGGMLGGVQWGPAADRETAYVALSDIGLIPAPEGVIPDPKAGGGIFAIQLATGEKLWSVLPPPEGCKTPRCSPAQSAAVTVIPGAVFSGSVDGHLRAYDSKTGKILWDYDTAKEYKTVNGVEAKGGSIDGPGPAVAGGVLVVNSGYAFFNGMPGNVLLAFSADGQ
jgi:polyvinyl alcohol dehydrogenase (cytochrome)